MATVATAEFDDCRASQSSTFPGQTSGCGSHEFIFQASPAPSTPQQAAVSTHRPQFELHGLDPSNIASECRMRPLHRLTPSERFAILGPLEALAALAIASD
jgi:hypothetical protein